MKTVRKTRSASYQSVNDLMVGLGLPRGVGKRVAELHNGTKIVDWLVQERNRAGLTQAELARRMGCSQSKVSKLEDSRDEDLRLGEIGRYWEGVRG